MYIRLLPTLFLCGCSVFIEDTNTQQKRTYSNIDLAEEFLNMEEKRHRAELHYFLGVDPSRVEWCAAFINAILETKGVEGTNSLLARSFLNWGVEVDRPKKGDIVVLRRGTEGWQGHVAFFGGETTIDGVAYYVLLGGNQENMVTYDLFKVSNVIGIRRGETNAHRVSL